MPDFYIDSNSLQDDSDATWNSATLSFLDTAEYLADAASGVGDVVWYASNHLEQYTGATKTLAYYDDSVLISVNSATDELTDGARVETTGIYNLNLNCSNADGGIVSFSGVYFTAGNNLDFSLQGIKFIFDGCKWALSGTSSSDTIDLSVDGLDIIFNNSEIDLNNAGQDVYITGGSRFQADNLTLTLPASHDHVFDIGVNGGGNLIITNSDLSGATISDVLIEEAGDINDIVNVYMSRVLIGSYGIISNVDSRTNRYCDFYSLDSGDVYYKEQHSRREGDTLESTTVKRTGGATYDGTNGFSAEFQPNSNVAAYTQPLRIKIAELELDLTSANTLTFHLAMQDTASITASSITNDKYWIEIEQNDSTDNALGLTKNTKPTDILTTPSALANVATTWTGRTLTYEDEFQIPITTTVVSGMTNGQVTAYLCVAESVSTREIFVCPSPVVT